MPEAEEMRIEIRLELCGSPARLDVLAARFAPGDTIPLSLEWIDLSSPDLTFEERCRVRANLIQLV